MPDESNRGRGYVGHNGAPMHRIEKVYFRKEDVSKFYKGMDGFSIRNNEIFVRFPYHEELKDYLKNVVKGRWDGKLKCWRVAFARHEKLKVVAQRIADLNEVDWIDSLNSDDRSIEGDVRIFVNAAHIDEYVEGSEQVHKGNTYIVTHVGRAREDGGNINHSVFLMPLARYEAQQQGRGEVSDAGGQPDDDYPDHQEGPPPREEDDR
ncbi:hypothetical protein D2T29_12605 [Sinirhodobacter populi]|uniref:Uncharacterized protein n=1 Tax=Paenirhodobacter populi TaxID=2306993 RepID=A0A443KCP6_9RHOB|nr:hypothetical protein [Sinirhodobacter populi]RWR30505.1 hypothetical protein D2T29_12605 [Sinirhodobacter populi]